MVENLIPAQGGSVHPDFLRVLCSPEDGSDLHLAAEEYYPDGMVKKGTLSDGKRRYPIIDGIPRFVDEERYAGSFGYEWKKWPRLQFEAENVGGCMAGHTKRMFETITGISGEDLKGKLIVEFGCGPGRFLDIVRSKGGIAVGIELSRAVEPARENFRRDPDVLIIQGDILSPPVKKGIFDVGYTIGVLHHTPSPSKGLLMLAESVKRGGIVACSVYPKKGFYDFPSVAMYRKILNALSPRIRAKIALAYAYFSAYGLYYVLASLRRVPVLGWRIAYVLEKYLLVNLDLKDGRWRVLDVFDAITPRYASTHTGEEVEGWFRMANLQDVRRAAWDSTSIIGVKG
jgi:SAM-dependent methyltransferase